MGSKNTQQADLVETLLIVGAFAICCLVTALISAFFKFHIDLVLANRTTIENLDRKRQEETGQTAQDVNPVQKSGF